MLNCVCSVISSKIDTKREYVIHQISNNHPYYKNTLYRIIKNNQPIKLQSRRL